MVSSRTERIYGTILLLAIGPVLIAIHPSIPFLNDGNCDPWFLFGTFYHFPDAAHWIVSPPAYPGRQITRLTQVIPGYLLTKAFNGITADYVMFFMYYAASVLFLYRAVRILIGDKVALFAAMVFAVHPLIIANYSVTFASPAITYAIVSLYLVARALVAETRLGRLWLLLASGLAMGAALHAYPGIAAFGIANYLIYFFYEIFNSAATISRRIWHLLQAGFVVVAGMVGFTIALGGLAVLFGAGFSLVFLQFLTIPVISRNMADFFWKPDWYLHGGIAGILLSAFLSAGINIYLCSFGLTRLALPENVRRRVSAVSWAILVLVILLLVYNELGGIFLQYDHYYVFFVPYFCIVVFSPLLFLDADKSGATVVWSTLFLICCLGAIALNDEVLGWLHLRPIEALASMTAAICAALVYSSFVLTRRVGRKPAALYVAVVVLMFVIVRPEHIGAQIWTSPRDLQYAREYQRIREGLALLEKVHFTAYPKFWVDTENAPSDLMVYPQTYLSCVFQGPFPAVDQELWNVEHLQFTPGDNVVIVAKAPNLPAVADTAFAALGLEAKRVADFSLLATTGENYGVLVEHVSGTIAASSEYKWLSDEDPPPDAEEISDAFGPPLGSGPNSKSQDVLPAQVSTPAQPYAYGAQFRPRIDLTGPIWIRVQADVHSGPIGIGILNRRGDAFLSRTSVAAAGATTIKLRVINPEPLGNLVVQSWKEGKPAEATIDAISVWKPRSPVEGLFGKTSASSSDVPADADEIRDAFGPPVEPGSASKLQDMFPVQVSTPAQPWAYGAQFPLRIQDLKGPLWIRIRADVHGGPIGIGVLNQKGDDFLSRTPVVTSGDTTVTLDVPKPQQIGDLVIQTWDEGNPGTVRVDAIAVIKPHPPAAEHR